VADDLDAECAGAWRDYDSALAEHYTRYFERHPELRGEHRYSARDLAAALPPDSSDLADLVAPGELHRHHLSGKSSQTLAVGLLGVSARLDPSLAWLWDALAPLPPASTPAPRISFEQRLARDVLGEQPRQTAIDALVDDPTALICIETKWSEQGLGYCSCGPDGGNPIQAAARGASRGATPTGTPQLSYSVCRRASRRGPVRSAFPTRRCANAAAARALAKAGQLAVFALIYDAKNPYLAGSGAWPGWPLVLAQTVEANADPQQFRFAAISWQELLRLLQLDEETWAWAVEKHGLRGQGGGGASY
jgi:hypothetical protein